MKLALYDTDVRLAAMLAVGLKRVLGPGTDIQYVQNVGDIGLVDVVIADPSPQLTADWLAEFRQTQPTTSLILTSESPDLIRGCAKDPCFAISKPLATQDLVGVLKAIKTGNWKDEKVNA